MTRDSGGAKAPLNRNVFENRKFKVRKLLRRMPSQFSSFIAHIEELSASFDLNIENSGKCL